MRKTNNTTSKTAKALEIPGNPMSTDRSSKSLPPCLGMKTLSSNLFCAFSVLNNCPQTTSIRSRQHTRHNASNRPSPPSCLPNHTRNSSTTNNLAWTRLLPRRISLRPTHPLRPRVHTPLFTVFMAGPRALHTGAVRNREHTIHRCGCDIA